MSRLSPATLPPIDPDLLRVIQALARIAARREYARLQGQPKA